MRRDVAEGAEGEVVINVMLMDGAVVVRKEKEEKKEDVEMKEAVEGEKKEEVKEEQEDIMAKEEFWSEMKAFLAGKLGGGSEEKVEEEELGDQKNWEITENGAASDLPAHFCLLDRCSLPRSLPVFTSRPGTRIPIMK